jgi:hypothetical protein
MNIIFIPDYMNIKENFVKRINESSEGEVEMKDIKFTKGNWEEYFEYAYTRRFPFKPEFIQEEDCISNSKNPEMKDVFDYTTIMTKEKYGTGTRLWVTCSFENYGAPLITLTDNLKRDEDGNLSYGACHEVVLWEKGINVWNLFEEKGEIKYHKLLAVEFPLEAGIKHEMYIELDNKAVKVVIGDKTQTLRIENLSEEVYIGITGCEDINRFYSVKIDN